MPPVMISGGPQGKLIDAVLGTILGQFLEIEDFAHAQAHGRDHDPCQGWLASLVSFGRTSTPQVSLQIAAISFSCDQ